MIKSIKHKGLRAYWERDETRHLATAWLPKIDRILDALDVAITPEDMNIPGFHFHGLIGKQKDRFSVRVSGNWRITFEFDREDVILVNLEDYH